MTFTGVTVGGSSGISHTGHERPTLGVLSQSETVSKSESLELPGMKTLSKLKYAKTHGQKQRRHMGEVLEDGERDGRAIQRWLAELIADELKDVEDGGDYSTKSYEDEEEFEPIPTTARRNGMQKNVAQQSATLAVL